MRNNENQGRRATKRPQVNASYAGLSRRLLAFGYDYILIAIYIGFLVAIGLWLSSQNRLERFFADAVSSDLSAFLLMILPVIVYFGWQEGSPRAATWGKRRVGLRVVSADGKPISRARALLRAALKFLPWQIGHTAVFQSLYAGEGTSLWITLLYVGAYGLAFAYLWALWRRPDHRPLYDVLAGTVVIAPVDRSQSKIGQSKIGRK